jgi:hypothetical protein
MAPLDPNIQVRAAVVPSSQASVELGDDELADMLEEVEISLQETPRLSFLDPPEKTLAYFKSLRNKPTHALEEPLLPLTLLSEEISILPLDAEHDSCSLMDSKQIASATAFEPVRYGRYS